MFSVNFTNSILFKKNFRLNNKVLYTRNVTTVTVTVLTIVFSCTSLVNSVSARQLMDRRCPSVASNRWKWFWVVCKRPPALL